MFEVFTNNNNENNNNDSCKILVGHSAGQIHQATVGYFSLHFWNKKKLSNEKFKKNLKKIKKMIKTEQAT